MRRWRRRDVAERRGGDDDGRRGGRRRGLLVAPGIAVGRFLRCGSGDGACGFDPRGASAWRRARAAALAPLPRFAAPATGLLSLAAEVAIPSARERGRSPAPLREKANAADGAARTTAIVGSARWRGGEGGASPSGPLFLSRRPHRIGRRRRAGFHAVSRRQRGGARARRGRAGDGEKGLHLEIAQAERGIGLQQRLQRRLAGADPSPRRAVERGDRGGSERRAAASGRHWPAEVSAAAGGRRARRGEPVQRGLAAIAECLRRRRRWRERRFDFVGASSGFGRLGDAPFRRAGRKTLCRAQGAAARPQRPAATGRGDGWKAIGLICASSLAAKACAGCERFGRASDRRGGGVDVALRLIGRAGRGDRRLAPGVRIGRQRRQSKRCAATNAAAASRSRSAASSLSCGRSRPAPLSASPRSWRESAKATS